ncbi:MAG: hypothetical protein QNJ27_05330 [Simkaniaceae bacterium]|nr:hypothetical protein [Simkaniaceae bacterium]
MTRDIIPGTQGKIYRDQKSIIQKHAQQSGIPYELPTALEAATAILLEHVKTRKKLYDNHYTLCQETVTNNQRPTAIGSFSAGGLDISYSGGYHDNKDGVGCVCEVVGYRFLDLRQWVGARWKIAIGPHRSLEAPRMILLGARKISSKRSETAILLVPNKHFLDQFF